MARTVATLPAGARITDYISLGVITKTFPLSTVRAVLTASGKTSLRERDLPAPVVMYDVIALALFMQASYREVLRCLLEGLQWLCDPAHPLKVAGKSGISQARTRLGWEALRQLHDGMVRPIARPATRGAWYRQWRLVSLDGSTLDVADEAVNAAAFGRPGSSRGGSAYPQIRFVALVENGTHVLFASHMAGCTTGETTLAQQVLAGLQRGMLCLADRQFFGFALWQQACATDAALLWRIKKNIRLPCAKRLPDGSYLSDLYACEHDRRHKTGGVPVRGRIDWKYALGLELTDPGFHFSVLTEFRARLVTGKAEHLLLDRMLERFKARGLIRARGKQRTDSTHILAAVHDLHLLELVAERLRATLDDLAATVPDWLRQIAPPVWFERYGRRIEDYRLPKRREEREALAIEIGVDGFTVLDALEGPNAPAAARQQPMVGTLRDVWRIHYAREGNGPPRWRTGAELPPVGERLQSPYDPEAHYSTKRQTEWSGYKVHVTETCDENAAHLITHVMTCPAMQPDMASTADIHKCLADKELLPAEHFVDAGYVDAALLVSSHRDHGVCLEGPVRAVAKRQNKAEQAYEQRHFAIDWEREQVTCPQGKKSVTWRRGLDDAGAPRICAVFSRTDCGTCAVRTLCTPAKAARRSVYFHPRPEYEALNRARARMDDPVWKERYRVRAGVEGTLSQGVRAFGMRRSRYIGLAKTGLQQVCTAAALNVARIVPWLAGTPRAKTRVTRFAALAQAA